MQRSGDVGGLFCEANTSKCQRDGHTRAQPRALAARRGGDVASLRGLGGRREGDHHTHGQQLLPGMDGAGSSSRGRGDGQGGSEWLAWVIVSETGGRRARFWLELAEPVTLLCVPRKELIKFYKPLNGQTKNKNTSDNNVWFWRRRRRHGPANLSAPLLSGRSGHGRLEPSQVTGHRAVPGVRTRSSCKPHLLYSLCKASSALTQLCASCASVLVKGGLARDKQVW